MGVLHFEVARRDRLPAFVHEVAHICGIDRAPWQGRTSWSDEGHLVHRREVGESGFFVCPWIMESGDWICLLTTSLREQPRPYQLERELARGTLSRARELSSQMESAVCPIGEEAREMIAASQSAFLEHLASGKVGLASQAIDWGIKAIEGLMLDLQRFQRARTTGAVGIPETLRVGTVGTPFADERLESRFLELFDTVAIPVRWRDVEREDGKLDWSGLDRWIDWAKTHRRRVMMGPLLRLDAHWLPEWVFLLRDRPVEILHRCVLEFIEAVVQRYQGRVDLWQCAAGLNSPGALGLDSDQRLRLAAAAIEAVRNSAGGTPVVMRFDQPWSESLVRNELELPSFHFADALVRADLGLRGIGIDFHWGYWPGGSLHRDSLAVHMQIQRWAGLELPLLVGFVIPHMAAEPLGPQRTVLCDESKMPVTAELQAVQLRALVGVAAGSPSVHGVAYGAFFDGDAPSFPGAGLVDVRGEVRPACRAWLEATGRG